MPSPTLLPIASIAADLTGERPSPATCWRWVHRGKNGIRLHAVFVVGQWRTTKEDFLRFLEECSAAKRGADQTESQAPSNDAALAAAGLL